MIPGGRILIRVDMINPSKCTTNTGMWTRHYVWDQNDKKYLDYGMALRAVTLGYANQRVNEAAIKQIENGNNLTRASIVELEAAELLQGYTWLIW